MLALVVELLLGRCREAYSAQAHTVVFVVPAVGGLEDALRDALSAQLAGGETELLFERFSPVASTLRRQVTEARTFAATHHAVGVFWLDAPEEKDWLLYLSEPEGDRVLVRRIAVETNGVVAALEAVAVITAESSLALGQGETIGMEPVQVPPEAIETPEPAEPRASRPVRRPGAQPSVGKRLFVGLGYYGDGPAREIPWQSGIRLSAGVRFPSGLYLNGGYLFFEQATVRGSQLTFQVTRNPVDLGLGVAFGRKRWVPAIELRGFGDILTRDSISTVSTLQAAPKSTRVMIFVSPRARLDYVISASFGVYGAAGMDFALNSFSFVSRVNGEDHALLRPTAVRPAFELGASFSL